MGDNKFDDLLTQLGTGRWSWLYFLASSYWFLLLPPQFISGVYLAPALNYTCRPPDNLTDAVLSEDSCSWSFVEGGVEEPCTEWDFDTSVFSTTLTSEFSLVCERGYLRATYQSIYMLGTFLSPILAGYLADRFGRYVVVVVSQVVIFITSVTLAFLYDFTAILAVRFLGGSVNLLTFYILALEVCEPKHRGTVGILTGLPWAIGTMMWGGAAFLIRDWRYLQLAVSLPTIFIFPALYFIDESPRWLIVRGHHDRALRVLQKAARWNRSTLPPVHELHVLMRDIQEESTENTSKRKDEDSVGGSKKKCRLPGLPNLFKNRTIAIITTMICVDYFAVSLVFDGLNMSGDSYSSDPFLYLVLSGLVEVPGYSLTAPLIDRCGRRIPTAVSYLLCGVVVFALAFIPTDMAWLVMVLALVGKLCISGAYQIIYVYSTELFPTEVRLQGIGVASLMAQLASTILPYITSILGDMLPWLPSVIFGTVSMIAAAATLALKDTLGVPLPDTIADLTSSRHHSSRRSSDFESSRDTTKVVATETTTNTNDPFVRNKQDEVNGEADLKLVS